MSIKDGIECIGLDKMEIDNAKNIIKIILARLVNAW